jgi:UDP-N-acetylmuramoyl-tripeptide--D-alanyl-D-alanine ligase
MVESGRVAGLAHSAVAVIEVADTAAGLWAIGTSARERLGGQVVGVTGSVGKTSTKDLAAGALASTKTLVASPRSYNNELGLPLTLANAPEGCEVAVLEMGARGHGHIARLCDLARPDIGVVTAVAKAHIEMLGDLDGVARARGELIEALPPGGAAVLNGDDERVRAMASRGPARPIFYSVASHAKGAGRPADVVGENVRLDAQLRPTFDLRSPWGSTQVFLEARGAHQVSNALAALSVAGVVGVDITQAAQALRDAPVSPLRMELHKTLSGATLINDSYNANPASMIAALRALRDLQARRRVAVLGAMAELGDTSAAEHRRVADMAHHLGVDLVAVGTSDYGQDPLQEPSKLLQALGEGGSGTAILVKASRAAGLDSIAARLIEEF